MPATKAIARGGIEPLDWWSRKAPSPAPSTPRPLATMADFTAYHAMLVDAQKLVGDALAAGKDAAAMKKENLLAKYTSWNWQFINADRFIDMLVRDAQQK